MIRAKAAGPATIGNAGVGFDILGFALDVLEDIVEVQVGDPGVRIEKITGVVDSLPTSAAENTATAGLLQLIADRRLPYGFDVFIHKGIPIGSGMGGSAASAVAAIVAANAVLDEPLSDEEIANYALIGEAVASGAKHPDNVAPCIMGGLVYCGTEPWTKIPVPDNVAVAVVHPHIEIKTADSRRVLPDELSLKTHIKQTSALTKFLMSAYRNDSEMFCRSCVDFVAEPYRDKLIPGFAQARFAALEAGAYSFSIGGSGPTVFAFAQTSDVDNVRHAIENAFEHACDSWSTKISFKGARLESVG